MSVWHDGGVICQDWSLQESQGWVDFRPRESVVPPIQLRRHLKQCVDPELLEFQRASWRNLWLICVGEIIECACGCQMPTCDIGTGRERDLGWRLEKCQWSMAPLLSLPHVFHCHLILPCSPWRHLLSSGPSLPYCPCHSGGLHCFFPFFLSFPLFLSILTFLHSHWTSCHFPSWCQSFPLRYCHCPLKGHVCSLVSYLQACGTSCSLASILFICLPSKSHPVL